MKSSIRNLLAGALMAMGTQSVWAQASDTATADATVTVVTPLTVTKSTDLNFGTVVRPLIDPATIFISPTGDRFGATFLGGGATAATFTVSGQGMAYTASVTTNRVNSLQSGVELGGIQAECDGPYLSSSGFGEAVLSDCALTNNGTGTVRVGADLYVEQAGGPFTDGAVSLGTIQVVVAYN